MLNTTRTIGPSKARIARRSGVAMAGAGLLLGAMTACSGGAEAEALALEIPSFAVAQACAELTPETMASADVAFKGEVTDVTDDLVTLKVEDRFAGEVPETVTIPQQQDGQPSELSVGVLSEGEEYLIAAQEGNILTCGQSGPATDELEALYEAAYQQ